MFESQDDYIVIERSGFYSLHVVNFILFVCLCFTLQLYCHCQLLLFITVILQHFNGNDQPVVCWLVDCWYSSHCHFSVIFPQFCILWHIEHWIIARDQPNSRFHGRDIFRKIGLLPWKTLISVKSVIFLWILTFLLSFMKVSEFYQQHLCRFCCLLRVTLEH